MLTLPIKAKWFDMIASGEKREEYRTISPYYNSRFFARRGCGAFWMRFRNGYRTDSPLMECLVSVRIDEGAEQWGAVPGLKYYVLLIYSVVIINQRIKQ